jgi:aspartate-semialdehyde dehydrogenase
MHMTSQVAWETQKILNSKNIKVSCTAVRIPTLRFVSYECSETYREHLIEKCFVTFRAHSEAITIETEKPITAEEVTKILENAEGSEHEQIIETMPFTMSFVAS